MPATTTGAKKRPTTPSVTISLPPALAEAARPFYSAVGAYDAAFAAYQKEAKALATSVKELRGSVRAQVRELPATIQELRGAVEAQANGLPELAKDFPAKAQAQVKELREALEAQARELPELLRHLPAKAQAQVTDLQKQLEATAGRLQKQAADAYLGYARRGEKLVSPFVRTTPVTTTAARKPAAKPAGTKAASH